MRKYVDFDFPCFFLIEKQKIKDLTFFREKSLDEIRIVLWIYFWYPSSFALHVGDTMIFWYLGETTIADDAISL